jgi:anti-sigma B factor antagonist
MPLEVHRREIEGITVLDLRGRLIAGTETTDLRNEFEQLIQQGKRNVVLDLGEVDFIDSTGLGTLLVGHSKFQAAGGVLKLAHLSKRSAELLILTKLSTIFPLFENERAAINSFFPDREQKHFDILEFVRRQQPEDLNR